MKTLLKSLPLSLLATIFIACGTGIPSISEPKPDVSSPSAYSKNGLEFQYPGNWKLGKEIDKLGIQQAPVESTGSALVFVQKYPAPHARDLVAYAEYYSKNLKDHVPVGKLSPFTTSPVRKMGDYEYLKMDYSITVLGETVPHECTMYRKTVGATVLFIITQVATEDLANAQPGFDLVRKTLKYQGN